MHIKSVQKEKYKAFPASRDLFKDQEGKLQAAGCSGGGLAFLLVA
jgi:hypothetical protein